MQLLFLTTSSLFFLGLLLSSNPACSATTTTSSSTTSPSSPSASTATPAPEIICNAQYGTSIQANDCHDALTGMPTNLQLAVGSFVYGDPAAFHFSLPKLLHAGSCTFLFSLDDQSPDARVDAFSWIYPLRLANELARQCVVGQGGQGGWIHRAGFRVLLVNRQTTALDYLITPLQKYIDLLPGGSGRWWLAGGPSSAS